MAQDSWNPREHKKLHKDPEKPNIFVAEGLLIKIDNSERSSQTEEAIFIKKQRYENHNASALN